MKHPKAGFGANYQPETDHHHTPFHDSDVVDQLGSPFHGTQGTVDEGKHPANSRWLDATHERGAGRREEADTADKDKQQPPDVVKQRPRGDAKVKE